MHPRRNTSRPAASQRLLVHTLPKATDDDECNERHDGVAHRLPSAAKQILCGPEQTPEQYHQDEQRYEASTEIETLAIH